MCGVTSFTEMLVTEIRRTTIKKGSLLGNLIASARLIARLSFLAEDLS
jgi:hypothetical protein